MDVDKKKSTSIHTQNLLKLTPEQCKKLFKEGKCYRCRQKGHKANECDGSHSVSSPQKGKKTQKEIAKESPDPMETEEELLKKKEKKD